jgi:hypothetical protein
VNGTTESRSQSVLYTCSYVPEENILAAGSQPRRFLPEGLLADAYVHPSRCGYVKSMLGAAVERAAVGGRRAPSRASGPESIVTTVTSSRDPRAPSRWAVHEERPESEKAGSWQISGGGTPARPLSAACSCMSAPRGLPLSPVQPCSALAESMSLEGNGAIPQRGVR